MGTAGTLAGLVADVATTDPDQPAIDGLAACGVRPGDRVALMVPNCPEFAIAYGVRHRLLLPRTANRRTYWSHIGHRPECFVPAQAGPIL